MDFEGSSAPGLRDARAARIPEWIERQLYIDEEETCLKVL
jgi:hypothetical protein